MRQRTDSAQPRSGPTMIGQARNAPRFGLRIRNLRRDRRGSVAPIAAVAIIVLAFAGFGALDFHTATALRSDLQDSLDAATLAVARTNLTRQEDVQTYGADLLRRSLHKSAAGAALESVEFKEVNGVMTGVANLSFKPIIAGMMVGQSFKVGASSQVARAGDNLEVALVLDNTYSMLGTRLATLKTSASNFVDILEHAAGLSRDPNALKISLVPFSTTVNVGETYKSAAWMDTTAISSIHDDIFNQAANRFTLFGQMKVKWAGCVESRKPPYDVQDTAPTATMSDTLFVPYFAPDEHDDWTYYWTNDYLPDGSTADWATRQKRVGKYNQAPTKNYVLGNGYSTGPNYGCELQPLVRLTTDGDKIKKAIGALTVTGDTIIPFGLMWGWHTLSPNAPFADGSAYGKPKTKKIAVLMTDGQNASYDNGSPNASIYSGIAYLTQGRIGITSGTDGARRDALDARLTRLCNNMKAKGILIYTIRLEVTEGSADVLRNCASKPEMFHDVSRASQLDAAFREIAADIQNLRLAK